MGADPKKWRKKPTKKPTMRHRHHDSFGGRRLTSLLISVAHAFVSGIGLVCLAVGPTPCLSSPSRIACFGGFHLPAANANPGILLRRPPDNASTTDDWVFLLGEESRERWADASSGCQSFPGSEEDTLRDGEVAARLSTAVSVGDRERFHGLELGFVLLQVDFCVGAVRLLSQAGAPRGPCSRAILATELAGVVLSLTGGTLGFLAGIGNAYPRPSVGVAHLYGHFLPRGDGSSLQLWVAGWVVGGVAGWVSGLLWIAEAIVVAKGVWEALQRTREPTVAHPTRPKRASKDLAREDLKRRLQRYASSAPPTPNTSRPSSKIDP